jgi:molybdenum cofactor biosynthesis enzyme
MPRYVYLFEDLTEPDLPRAPLAALRALRVAGITISRAGWLTMPVEARVALAEAGTRDVVTQREVQTLIETAPIREMKLMPRIDDPPVDEVPAFVHGAFGPTRPITPEFWRSIRALDRHVLCMFVNNTRLLWRALAEISVRSRQGISLPAKGWTGELARCDLRMPAEWVNGLLSPSFHDGRACVLARVAGIRAARWASEILDLHAALPTGPVEVGYSWDQAKKPGMITWQAHVSTQDCEFSPSASLLAAVTAATALHDILRRAGVASSIEKARMVEEPWLAADSEDEVTIGL